MKHMFKAIMAIALSFMLALSMFALADGDVLEGENQVEAQAAEQAEEQDEGAEAETDIIDATPVEPGEATPQEIEMDLPELDEEPVDEKEDDGEKPVDGETDGEKPVDEKASEVEPSEEESAGEKPVDEKASEAEPSEEESAVEESAVEESADEYLTEAQPTANALVYTGEAQALVEAGEGWLFSLDGENYAPEIPTGIDAGEYAVYYIPADDADAEPVALTVIIEKADVTLIPPVANVF